MKGLTFAFAVILFLSMNVVNADQGAAGNTKPQYLDHFKVTYDEVNDVTNVSENGPYGDGVPGTGDTISGHQLMMLWKISFPGKKYSETGASVNLTFTEVHYDKHLITLTLGNKYETGDTVSLLAGDQHFKLGTANYTQSLYGDDFIGHTPVEVLNVTAPISLVTAVANSPKFLGAITAVNPESSKPFVFDQYETGLAQSMLYILDSLR
jgi:hypothetical protein